VRKQNERNAKIIEKINEEREWQNNQLPEEIKEIVLNERIIKEKSFKLI
jgi:hypothetical protein